MNNKSVTVIFFSPTGTTKRVATKIAESLDVGSIEYIDLTKPENRQAEYSVSTDYVIVGVPVYEEYIPDFVEKALSNFSFSGQAAIAVSVYGKVGFGLSLKQLYSILTDKGLSVGGMGAFIGEHSFATDSNPLAMGRPDSREFDEAEKLAQSFMRRCEQKDFIESADLVPGKLPLMSRLMPSNSAKIFTKMPEINQNCNGCKLCIKKCPMGAIDSNLQINDDLCIRCFACVKSCKFDGREIKLKKKILVKPMFAMNNLKDKKKFII
jgi:ferredoxin